MTLQDLIGKALDNGFREADIVTTARLYHQQSNIHRLTGDQIEDLDRRLSARIAKRQLPREGASRNAS